MKYLGLHIIICCLLFSCNKQTKYKPVLIDDENLELVNGILIYKEKTFSGEVVSYHNNSKHSTKVQYTNGKKHGEEYKWSSNGILLEERFYIKGNKTGVHKGWWDSNLPKFEYVFNNNGMYDGSVMEWYKNGQLYKSFNYKHGKEFGSQKLWKQDGDLKANYEVVDGERFGLIGLKKCYTVTVDENEIK